MAKAKVTMKKIVMVRSVASPTFSYGGGGVYDVPTPIANDLIRSGHAKPAEKTPIKTQPKDTSSQTRKTADGKAPKTRAQRKKT